MSSLDETTLATLSHLESRLLRLEHILYGHTTSLTRTSAIASLQQLEHRFASLLQHVRVYAELFKFYNAHPHLVNPPPSSSPTPPSDLPTEALTQIILASASSFPAIASTLSSIHDTPIPDAALSANLAALLPRMKGIEATQLAQAAEIAELRARSEVLIRQWYEHDVMGYSEFVAGVEGRVQAVERGVRRMEKASEDI